MALVAGGSAPALAQIGCRLNDKGPSDAAIIIMQTIMLEC